MQAPADSSLPLHPDLEPLAFLIGTWQGEGRGDWPTTEPFGYGEEIVFDHLGQPFLAYRTRAWSLEDGQTMHSERGFWRPLADGKIDVTIAHPFGVVEATEGPISGTVITLRSTAVGRATDGEAVTLLERRYEVADDTLTYELSMATETEGLRRHAAGLLRRV